MYTAVVPERSEIKGVCSIVYKKHGCGDTAIDTQSETWKKKDDKTISEFWDVIMQPDFAVGILE